MTENESEPIYVRKIELAKRLSVSPRTIDTWVAKRIIPVIATSPRLHLFDLEAVRLALEKRFEVPPRGSSKPGLSIRWEKANGQNS